MAPHKKAKSGKETSKPKPEPKPAPFKITSEGAIEATGSKSAAFKKLALSQALEALWLPDSKTQKLKEREMEAAYEALRSVAPRSELEGMLAVQMISTHNAAMECLRRAMIEEQSFEGRNTNLKHAVKLMGLYERQLAALDKHRGKGQQKITVEHVTVEAGGQAIVGNVNAESKAGPDNDANAQALRDESAADELGREALKNAKPAKKPVAGKRRK